MTPPVVCFCNTNPGWGGGEKWHLEAAIALAHRGRRVLLMAHPAGRLHAEASRLAATLPAHLPGLRVLPLQVGRLTFLNPGAIVRIAHVLHREKVDSLVLGLTSDLKAVGPAARLAGVRQVFYRRGSALPIRNTAFNRLLYGRVINGLIVNSQETRRLALVNNAGLIPEERIHLLHNGIDATGFDAALKKASPAYRASGHTLVIGNAGRLNRQKGQHHLLHMARLLADEGLDFRLVIAGEGERRQELETLARTLGVSGHVVFAGFLADLAPFWKSLDVFVLSSHWEGFGYVLAEAMLAEVPVVSFDVSNIPELVQDGTNGLLVPGPDAAPEGDAAPAAGLARAVMTMAASQDLRCRMGAAGRAHALAKYAQESCMDALESILGSAPR